MPFSLIVPALGPDDAHTLTAQSTPPVAFSFGSDFFPERYSPAAEATGPVVFVGFGISSPEIGHNDYEGYDVAGKVVLALNHEPGEYDPNSRFDGIDTSEHSRNIRKAREADYRGAIAVLFAADVHNHDSVENLTSAMTRNWPVSTSRTPRYELGAWAEQVTIPVMQIARSVADQLANSIDTTLSDLALKAESAYFEPVELNTTISVATDVSRTRVTADNVLGLIEGSDPARLNEWLIVGAHYDHEGSTGTQVFHGADDNASGVAGILEIAQAFAIAAQSGQRPPRSVLFAAWNAEERGLLGAWAYSEQPLAPLTDTLAVINLDMIGRDEEVPARGGRRFRGLPRQTALTNSNAVNILGYSYSDDLRRAASNANVVDLTIRFRYDHSRSNLLRRSDHWPFLVNGVPALFIHTGLHPDYHTTRDSADKLNYEKMTRIVQFVYQLAWDLVSSDQRPLLN